MSLFPRWYEKKHESATAGAAELSADRTGLKGCFVHAVNIAGRDMAGKTSFEILEFLNKFADIPAFCSRLGMDVQSDGEHLVSENASLPPIGMGRLGPGLQPSC